MESIVSARPIDHRSGGKLIGLLSFASTNVFGLFARPSSQEPCGKLGSSPLGESRGDHFIDNLSWWISALRAGVSLAVSLKPVRPKFIMYTDARCAGKRQLGGISDIIRDRRLGGGSRKFILPPPKLVFRMDFAYPMIFMGLGFPLVASQAVRGAYWQVNRYVIMWISSVHPTGWPAGDAKFKDRPYYDFVPMAAYFRTPH